MKKVFVIIVTYNGMQWINKCLKSLENTSLDVRTLVIDNNSTDGTQNYIKNNFPEVILTELTKNLGFGQANNIGLSYAFKENSDYVFLLNQDAWLGKNTIENLINAQQKEPRYGIISPMHLNGKGDALDVSFSNYIVPRNCKKLFSDIYLNKLSDKLYLVNFVNAAGWLISRNCLELVGGFNPSFFHYGEDDNYIQRVQFHNLKLGILATETLYHDREQRTENVYFEDKMIVYKREIICRASNPLGIFSFRLEYIKLLKALLISLFFIQGNKIRILISRINILYSLDKGLIINNKIISKEKKTAFLDV